MGEQIEIRHTKNTKSSITLPVEQNEKGVQYLTLPKKDYELVEESLEFIKFRVISNGRTTGQTTK